MLSNPSRMSTAVDHADHILEPKMFGPPGRRFHHKYFWSERGTAVETEHAAVVKEL